MLVLYVPNKSVKDLADGGGSGVTKVNVKTPQTVMTRAMAQGMATINVVVVTRRTALNLKSS